MFYAFRSESSDVAFAIRNSFQIVGTFRLILLCLPFITFIVTVSSGFADDTLTGNIVAVKGLVTAKKPGAEDGSLASNGYPIHIGDTLKTGKESSAQLQLSDGALINLPEETIIRINQYVYEEQTMRRVMDLRVIQGTPRVIVYKQMGQGSVMRLLAGSALVAANGICDFAVAKLSGRTEVISLKGVLRVKNSLPFVVGEVRVDINQKIVVYDKMPPSSPKTINPVERRKFLKGFRSN